MLRPETVGREGKMCTSLETNAAGAAAEAQRIGLSGGLEFTLREVTVRKV